MDYGALLIALLSSRLLISLIHRQSSCVSPNFTRSPGRAAASHYGALSSRAALVVNLINLCFSKGVKSLHVCLGFTAQPIQQLFRALQSNIYRNNSRMTQQLSDNPLLFYKKQALCFRSAQCDFTPPQTVFVSVQNYLPLSPESRVAGFVTQTSDFNQEISQNY